MITINAQIVVPVWANFIAQDPSGIWYFHEYKPKINWHFQEWESKGLFEEAYKGKFPEDWTQELWELY